MKYLLIQRAKWSTGYEVNEFSTAAELSEQITHNGIKDAIVAERKDITLQLAEWIDSSIGNLVVKNGERIELGGFTFELLIPPRERLGAPSELSKDYEALARIEMQFTRSNAAGLSESLEMLVD